MSESLKRLSELAAAVSDDAIKAEMVKYILAAYNDHAELQERLATLRSQNVALAAQVAATEQKEDIRSRLTITKAGVYMLNDAMGHHPICPACFEKSGLTIPLAPTYRTGRPSKCPACPGLYFTVPPY